MELDTNKIHRHILKKLNRLNKPQKYLAEKLIISRVTFYRLSLGKDITVETLFKLVQWLDKDINSYIKYNGEEKRLPISSNEQCRNCGY